MDSAYPAILQQQRFLLCRGQGLGDDAVVIHWWMKGDEGGVGGVMREREKGASKKGFIFALWG